LAREALAIARGRGNDNFELMALLALARGLVAVPDFDPAAVEEIARRCDHLIAVNHMGAYRADLDELTARLVATREREARW
jgi:hypothetical protein